MNDGIGSKIKLKRTELKLTQKQVAEKLFVTQQTVARWESDKHDPPIRALEDLSQLFNVDLNYFFDEEKEIKHRINLFALLGSVGINFILFWIVGILLVSLFITIWLTTIACFLSPIYVLVYQFLIQGTFSIYHLISSGVMCLVAFALIPFLKMITEYLYKILKAYYRYTVNSIFIEVVDK